MDALLKNLKPEQQELVKKYGPPAAVALVSIVVLYLVGIWNLIYLILVLGLILGGLLFRPLPEPSKTHEFASRRFSHLKIKDEYDYVVVGAGAAGCVLARRLADARGSDGKPKFSVLLMESGPSRHNDDKTHKDLQEWFGLLANREYDYDLSTANVPGMGGRQLQYGRGHTLGGSSTTNAMMWVAGHAADYDDWAGKHGAGEGWNWATVQRHLQSIEAFAAGKSHRGKDGPMVVREVGTKNKLHQAFIAAANACGIQSVDDYNCGDNTGIGFCQQNSTAKGERCDAFSVFIEPYLKEHTNLQVVDEARAHRVLFRGKAPSLTATGVLYSCGKAGSFVVNAKREVLLSAGAVHTPQLLMLSGIGPADHLREQGIQVRVNAGGVGSNLEEHVAVSIPVLLKDVNEVTPEGEGSGLCVNAHFKSSWSKKNEPERGPDMQLVGVGAPSFFITAIPLLGAIQLMAYGDRLSRRGVVFRNFYQGLRFVLVKTGLAHKLASKMYSCGVVLNHPGATGSIRLENCNPLNDPLITLAIHEETHDQARMVEGVKKAMEILGNNKMAPLLDGYERSAVELVGADDAAITAWVQKRGAHAWHPTSTVKIGAADDDNAPLTPDCRVKGVNGLRVVDASCMPAVISGNTHIPSLVIGSRAAEIILEEK